MSTVESTPRLTRASPGQSVDQAEIWRRFAAEGLQPYRWSNEPHYVYGVHAHPYHKALFCLSGSIRFTLPDTGGTLDLAPGDRLDLPAGTRHGAIVGPAGVVCLEAGRAAG